MEATKVLKIIVTVLLLGLLVGISRADDAKFKCPDTLPGEYVSMEDCSSYFRCMNGTANKHTCPKGLYFNQQELCCDWPQNSECLKMQISNAVISQGFDVTRMGISSLSASADLVFPANDSYCKGKKDGLYPYPTDCTLFYHCTNGYTIIKGCAYMTPYVTRLEFNDETKQCDWPWSSGCIASSIPTTGAPGISSTTRTTGVTTTKSTTTEAPSTNSTGTVAPSTNSTVTKAPSTNSTTTEAPFTNSTETKAPSTNSTTTEALSSSSTGTEAPSTNFTTIPTPSTKTSTTEAFSKITETTTTSTSDHPAVNFSCQEKECGRYRDPNNCNGYYICTENKSSVGYKLCPQTLIFNPIVADCDFPQNFNCSSTALFPSISA